MTDVICTSHFMGEKAKAQRGEGGFMPDSGFWTMRPGLSLIFVTSC